MTWLALLEASTHSSTLSGRNAAASAIAWLAGTRQVMGRFLFTRWDKIATGWSPWV
jgi:hypothetical protein